MKLNIDSIRCVGCGLCENVCIKNHIKTKPSLHEVDNNECFECDIAWQYVLQVL